MGLELAGVGRALAEGWQLVSWMRAFPHRSNSVAVLEARLEGGPVDVVLLPGLVP